MTLGIKDSTDGLEKLIVIIMTIVYVYLVLTGKAAVEGFVLLTALTLRKLLLGENSNGKDNVTKP